MGLVERFKSWWRNIQKEIDEVEALNEILMPLGMKVCLSTGSNVKYEVKMGKCTVSLMSRLDCHRTGMEGWYMEDGFSSVENLMECIFKRAIKFNCFYDRRVLNIDNPYFGCGSIDEAKVKKDLHVGA